MKLKKIIHWFIAGLFLLPVVAQAHAKNVSHIHGEIAIFLAVLVVAVLVARSFVR